MDWIRSAFSAIDCFCQYEILKKEKLKFFEEESAISALKEEFKYSDSKNLSKYLALEKQNLILKRKLKEKDWGNKELMCKFSLIKNEYLLTPEDEE